MAAPWTATVLTIFPEMFPGPLGCSLAGKALERDLWRLGAVDICAASPPTGTRRSTTRRSAAGPAW